MRSKPEARGSPMSLTEVQEKVLKALSDELVLAVSPEGESAVVQLKRVAPSLDEIQEEVPVTRLVENMTPPARKELPDIPFPYEWQSWTRPYTLAWLIYHMRHGEYVYEVMTEVNKEIHAIAEVEPELADFDRGVKAFYSWAKKRLNK